MSEEAVIPSGTGIVEQVATDPIQPEQPAPGADEQKPKVPASDADAQNPEDTPEQLEEKRESRRARSNARKAAALAEARTEARMLREQLAREEARRTPPAAPAEPNRDQFDSLEDYHKAIATHTARVEAQKAIEDDRKARTERESKASANADQQRISDAWEKGEEAFRKEAKDYDEVVAEFIESDLPDLDPRARQAILELGETGVGQKVLYHLAKNPDEADRIARLPPLRQVIEIGKLEEKVTPAKRTSNAPAPVSSVKGASATQGFRENMSTAEYNSWRKSQGARWAR